MRRRDSSQQETLTVAQLLERWLEAMRFQMRPSSYSVYESIVRKHLIPLTGEEPAAQFDKNAAQWLVASLKNRGLSQRSAGDAARKLQQALAWGSREGICPGNRPFFHIPTIRTEQLRFLSPEEERKLGDFLWERESASELGVLLVLDTGLALGELCALRWEAFDWAKGMLCVDKTMQRVASGGVSRVEILPLPIRWVPVPQAMIQKLKELPQGKNGWFLPGVKAPFTEPRTMQQRLKRYLAECGMDEQITFGDLRDTFFRNCMASGMDFIEISEISGIRDLNELWRRYGVYYQKSTG